MATPALRPFFNRGSGTTHGLTRVLSRSHSSPYPRLRRHLPSAISLAQQRRPLHTPGTVESTLQLTAEAITSFQLATGLPWYLTIPAIALSLNVLTRLPIQLYARKVNQGQLQLAPLIRAWRQRHELEILAQGGRPSEVELAEKAAKQTRQTMRRLFRKWGVQSWRMYLWVLNIPPFLVISDVLRRMSGLQGGLVSWVTGTSGSAATQLPPLETAPGVAGSILATTEHLTGATYTFLEPSFVTGGCLWFQDLTAADPFMILPLSLSAWLVVDGVPRDMKTFRMLLGLPAVAGDASTSMQQKAATPNRQLVVGRLRLFVLPVIPLLVSNLPSAVFIYWIASTAAGVLNRALIQLFIPIKKEFEKLARPNRSQEVLDPPR